MNKILGVLWNLPANQHSQFSHNLWNCARLAVLVTQLAEMSKMAWPMCSNFSHLFLTVQVVCKMIKINLWKDYSSLEALPISQLCCQRKGVLISLSNTLVRQKIEPDVTFENKLLLSDCISNLGVDFMITLISSQKSPTPNILAAIVPFFDELFELQIFQRSQLFSNYVCPSWSCQITDKRTDVWSRDFMI